MAVLIGRSIRERTAWCRVGTTSESPTLSEHEHRRVIEIVVEECTGRVPVIAGAGSNNTREAITYRCYAEEAGAKATLHVAGYYNRPSQEGLHQHFKAAHEATTLSIIAYNIPPRAVVDILPDTLARIATLPLVVGVTDEERSNWNEISSIDFYSKVTHYHEPPATTRLELAAPGALDRDTPSLAASEALGVAFANRAGCTDQTAACLRALPAAAVLANVGEFGKPTVAYNQSTVDGQILVETQRSALEAGRINRVSVLQGNTSDEGRIFLSGTLTLVEHKKTLESSVAEIGKDPVQALALYSLEHYPNAFEAASAAGGDRSFACSAQLSSLLLSKWMPTYAYEFSDAGAGALGATHAAELKYLFNLKGGEPETLDGPGTLSVPSQRLAYVMRVSWTTFAETGSPKSALIPHWPLASKGIQPLEPSLPAAASHSDFSARHKCAFWN